MSDPTHHWLKPFAIKLILALIVIAYIMWLRFFKLGQVPHGMTWDEAAIAYNGYSVITTRRDEWLRFLPVSFRSFGDYKSPLAIYLVGLVVTIFNSSLLVVRLPFAISGLLAIVGFYLLSRDSWKFIGLKSSFSSGRIFGLSSALLLATSPWHVHFSRVGFESGLSLTLAIWSGWWFVRYAQTKTSKKYFFGILSSLSFSASLYAYHSAKLVLPLWLFWCWILFWPKTRQNFKSIMFWAGLVSLWLIPLIYDSIWGFGLSRSGSLIFSQSNSVLEIIKTIIKGLAEHFNLGFLLIGATTTLRHGPGAWSVLLPSTLALAVIAVGLIYHHLGLKKLIWIIGLMMIGVLPAAMATEVPHANRALFAIIAWMWLAGFTLTYWWQLKNQKTWAKSLFGLAAILHLIFSLNFANYYFNEYPKHNSNDFSDGYVEVALLVEKLSKDPKIGPKISHITFTSRYGQPYIYILNAKRLNPIVYQGGGLANYLIKSDINLGDLQQPRNLVVATPEDDMGEIKPNYVILGSDLKPRFLVYLPIEALL